MIAVKTEELIAQLGADVSPVSRHAAIKRVSLAAAIGFVLSFLILLYGPGIRPDFVAASVTMPFWTKWAFTLSLAFAGLVIARRLGNPDGEVRRAWLGLGLPWAIVAMMAIMELDAAPVAQWQSLILGHTASTCSAAILVLSVPAFVACLLAFRRLAPVRLRLTGAVIGILSAAVGATAYAFACPETSATFMLAWYGIGMAASALIGTVVGPRFLRW